MQVEREGKPFSGGRVRNTWITDPWLGDTGGKLPLIPHEFERRKSSDGEGRVCGRLASWWGKSLPRRRSIAGLRGWPATLGLRTAQTPTGGSSEESSAMGASLTERRRVRDEAFRRVNRFSGGRDRTVPQEEVSANYVPAAAVIRRRRALSGVTGRKGCAGGSLRGW